MSSNRPTRGHKIDLEWTESKAYEDMQDSCRGSPVLVLSQSLVTCVRLRPLLAGIAAKRVLGSVQECRKSWRSLLTSLEPEGVMEEGKSELELYEDIVDPFFPVEQSSLDAVTIHSITA